MTTPSPTDPARDRALTKIRGLRTLAAGTSESNEAETALALAAELQARHGIADSELADAPALGEEVLEDTGERRPWLTFLAYHVARFYGCTAYNRWGSRLTHPPAKFFEIVLVGTPADISHARTMYAFFKLEVQSLAQRFAPESSSAAADRRKWFRLGAVEGLQDKLLALEKKAREREAQTDGPAPSNLVLTGHDDDAEKALVEAFQASLATRGAPTEGPPKDLPPPPSIEVETVDPFAFLQGHAQGLEIRVRRE